jgi:hypothetical protein
MRNNKDAFSDEDFIYTFRNYILIAILGCSLLLILGSILQENTEKEYPISTESN